MKKQSQKSKRRQNFAFFEQQASFSLKLNRQFRIGYQTTGGVI
jgi:hypothetical protein